MTIGGLVNIHFCIDQQYETYFVYVHSKKIAYDLLNHYARYWVDFWDHYTLNTIDEHPMSFDHWVLDFCGCRCVPVNCIQYEMSEEMFD